MIRHLPFPILILAIVTWCCSDFGTEPTTNVPRPLINIGGKIAGWSSGDTNTIYLSARTMFSVHTDTVLVLDSGKVQFDGSFSLNLRPLPDSLITEKSIFHRDSTTFDTVRVAYVSDLEILTPSRKRMGWARNCSATFWSSWLVSDYSTYLLYTDRETADHRVDSGGVGGKPYILYANLACEKGWNKVVDRVISISGDLRNVSRTIDNHFSGDWLLIQQ
jgi:hypothetical protein